MQNDPSALLAAFNPAVVANRAGSSMESLQGLSEFAQELLNHVNLVRQQRAAAMAEADAVGATTAHPDTVVSFPPQATIGTVSPPPRDEQEPENASVLPAVPRQPEPVLSAPAAALPEQQGQMDNLRGRARVDTSDWRDEDAALGDHPMFNHFDDDGDLALGDHPLFNNPRENQEDNNDGTDDYSTNNHNRYGNDNAGFADTVVKQEEHSDATPAETSAEVPPLAVTPPIKQEPEQESDEDVMDTTPAAHMPPDPVVSAATTDSAAGTGEEVGEVQRNDGDSVAQNYEDEESEAPTEAVTNATTTAAFTPRLRRPPQVKRKFPCEGRNGADELVEENFDEENETPTVAVTSASATTTAAPSRRTNRDPQPKRHFPCEGRNGGGNDRDSGAQTYEEENETPTIAFAALSATTTAALYRRTGRDPQPKRHFPCEGRNTSAAGAAAARGTTNTNVRLKVEAKLGDCPSLQPPTAAKRRSVSPTEMNLAEHDEKPPAKKLKAGKKKAPKKNVKVSDLSDDEIEVVKVTPQSVGINDSTMPRSVGLTRAVLNKHLDILGLLTFSQSVVSSKKMSNGKFVFSHLTLNMDWCVIVPLFIYFYFVL